MKTTYSILVFLFSIGLSSCTEIQNKLSNLTSNTNIATKNDSNQKNREGLTENATYKDKDVKKNGGTSGYYILGDGTYSTSKDYVVPKLSITFLERLIKKLRSERGGYIWVSYIDNESRDNETLFMKVPQPAGTTAKPNFMADGAINYRKKKQAWESQYRKEVSDSLLEAQQFLKEKQVFLDEAYSLLKNQVYIITERNKLSDVIGSVESALKVLTDAKRNNVVQNCFLIGFSDFQNDPECPALQSDPTVKVYNLISQPGKAKSIIPGSMEINDVEYLFSIL